MRRWYGLVFGAVVSILLGGTASALTIDTAGRVLGVVYDIDTQWYGSVQSDSIEKEGPQLGPWDWTLETEATTEFGALAAVSAQATSIVATDSELRVSGSMHSGVGAAVLPTETPTIIDGHTGSVLVLSFTTERPALVTFSGTGWVGMGDEPIGPVAGDYQGQARTRVLICTVPYDPLAPSKPEDCGGIDIIEEMTGPNLRQDEDLEFQLPSGEYALDIRALTTFALLGEYALFPWSEAEFDITIIETPEPTALPSQLAALVALAALARRASFSNLTQS